MSNDLVPVSEEQAKAIQEVAKATGQGIEAASKFFAFWAEVAGDAPHNLFAWLVGDRLHHARIRNLHRLWQRTEEILKGRGVKEPQKVSEDIGDPLLDAARKQDRGELQELWARLLAAAMDPARVHLVRGSFLRMVEQMDPLDALVLQKLSEHENWSPNARDALMTQFKRTPDEIEVSFANLRDLDCGAMQGSSANFVLSTKGRELMRAIRD